MAEILCQNIALVFCQRFANVYAVCSRKKHYLCISAPAMPLPKTPPSPGPGAYELMNHEREIKHYMSGAAFVSTTSRWNNNVRNLEFPGPGMSASKLILVKFKLNTKKISHLTYYTK